MSERIVIAVSKYSGIWYTFIGNLGWCHGDPELMYFQTYDFVWETTLNVGYVEGSGEFEIVVDDYLK